MESWTAQPTQRGATSWRFQATNDASPWTGTPTWTTLQTLTSLSNNKAMYSLSPGQTFTSYRIIIDGFMSGADETYFQFGVLI